MPASLGDEEDVGRATSTLPAIIVCLEQVQLLPLLKRLGYNARQCVAAVSSIIARMAAPGSKRASYRCLTVQQRLGRVTQSGLPGSRSRYRWCRRRMARRYGCTLLAGA